uniref:SOCS box domain-containing protein n=1 Tax=Biomphalaria glabrata TaxID=6526 RepID=A0A2C9KT39_BIOGL
MTCAQLFIHLIFNIFKLFMITIIIFKYEQFTSNYQPTVGVDYGFKVENINGCDVRVNIWDFSGSTDYLEVRNELYSKTNGIFLVFDVTNATTFDSLDQWLREITQYSSNSAQIFIVGNKVDLKHNRSVNQNNLKKLLQNYKCQYFETSAVTGEGVNDMFKAMLTTILILHLVARLIRLLRFCANQHIRAHVSCKCKTDFSVHYSVNTVAKNPRYR